MKQNKGYLRGVKKDERKTSGYYIHYNCHSNNSDNDRSSLVLCLFNMDNSHWINNSVCISTYIKK